ncbi:hypothetical protein ABIA33_000004 [Streptacidiphilus sp. MAP12-16]|uniref:hypothetical protein n=1 Tax=Streptacidiphilus sp. MAP12-16 TaxID=3156300 RepID=UPI0035177407
MTRAANALTHGYNLAFTTGAILFLAAMAVMSLAVTASKQHHTDAATPVHMGRPGSAPTKRCPQPP